MQRIARNWKLPNAGQSLLGFNDNGRFVPLGQIVSGNAKPVFATTALAGIADTAERVTISIRTSSAEARKRLAHAIESCGVHIPCNPLTGQLLPVDVRGDVSNRQLAKIARAHRGRKPDDETTTAHAYSASFTVWGLREQLDRFLSLVRPYLVAKPEWSNAAMPYHAAGTMPELKRTVKLSAQTANGRTLTNDEAMAERRRAVSDGHDRRCERFAGEPLIAVSAAFDDSDLRLP